MKRFAVCLLSVLQIYAGGQPNPPNWPSSVKVYDPSTPISTIQADMDEAYTINGNGSGQTWNGSPPITATDAQQTTNNVLPQSQWMDNGHFVNNRYAFLFKPGTYSGLNVYVGYYTSVIGLGKDQSATVIDYISCYMGNGQIDTPVCPIGTGGTANLITGGLNTFWRSIENFTTNPNTSGNVWWPTSKQGMTWAVSQACPMRKVTVNGNLYLFQLRLPDFAGGFTSGGFMADSIITGEDSGASAVTMGSQQQFLVRNCKATSAGSQPAFSNGVWNQVFVGTIGAPPSNCGNCPGQTGSPVCHMNNCTGCKPNCVQGSTGNPYTTVEKTPIIAEKPYIVFGHTPNKFSLAIPPVEINKVGPSNNDNLDITYVDFENVYVATPDDTAVTINSQITNGNHIILTPGTYNLTDSIVINKEGLVLLGIGFPTLISTTGKACVIVKGASNVRVGGILFQAGSKLTPTLLQWGEHATDAEHGFLYDCFARTGRFQNEVSEAANAVTNMVTILSNHVVGDNFWLWRADHDTQGLVKNLDNHTLTGFHAKGDHITTYGLACEHTFGDMTVWEGNHGECYFYQAEFPYDAPPGFHASGYLVGSSVTHHKAWGVGIYSFFRDTHIQAPMGIKVLFPGPGIQFTNSLTRYLAGNGGILSVLNGVGINTDLSSPAVSIDFPGPAYLCEYVGEKTVYQPYRTEERERSVIVP